MNLNENINIEAKINGVYLQRARFTNWLFRPCTLPKSQTQLIISPVIFYVI